MGDPRKQRKKFSKPSHPWQKLRIDEEKELTREFGLKNKNEIWRASSLLSDFKDRAKKLVTSTSKQGEVEKTQLLTKLASYGLLSAEANLDDVLSLTLRDILELRLQTIVHKMGLSKTAKQARQLITHHHILVNGKKVTVPGYLVLESDKGNIIFSPDSAFIDDMHPERVQKETLPKKPEEKKESEAGKEEKKPAKKTKPAEPKKTKKKAEEKPKEKPAKKEEVKKEK